MPIWVAIVVLRGLAFYILHFALKISARSSYSTYQNHTRLVLPGLYLVALLYI
jgi:hypothetical protein